MSDAVNSDALWLKARLFINHAMDDDEPRAFEERALWASLALEMLGKAALARVNPLLIAIPNEEGNHLLAASGLIVGDGPIMTVQAATVFKRCARAFRPFNASESIAIASNRNAYLHSGVAMFTPVPESAFWPAYWRQAAILVYGQDRDLEEFVGQDRVEVVEEFLTRNKQHIEERVEALLERAKQQLALISSGNAPERIVAAFRRNTDLRAGMLYSTDTHCPACGEEGTLEGEQEAGHELRYEQVAEDDFDVYVDVQVWADYFSCQHCRLVLDSAELIEAAGLKSQFDDQGDPADFVEAEYE